MKKNIKNILEKSTLRLFMIHREPEINIERYSIIVTMSAGRESLRDKFPPRKFNMLIQKNYDEHCITYMILNSGTDQRNWNSLTGSLSQDEQNEIASWIYKKLPALFAKHRINDSFVGQAFLAA